ncbi:FMN-binding negative transcriptional regulator [Kyrpidia sp.]|uniref:FMN-binding negative transcriptional regulator n=1 Tax=Kyrpidia sp. TaxID=2073077 RepID=UPI00258F5471|nr:FMN-binding negative transcriptional regulator [Kyrpidia sp.]MCL6575048.1 FMN-binding negative transcriptional regulator [Kyrpidia sp.]
MYIPEEFYMRNKDVMIQFIRENSFGILFSQVKGRPFATHLPLLLDPDRKKLFGHLAKANPHWRELDNKEVLIVFQGPHAYISPSWYVEKQAVPTWNYVAVHVSGNCQIVRDEKKLHCLLREMVRFYEPNSPLLERLDEEFYVKLEKTVVGIEIEITAVEGKAKLSQNKSPETVRGVIEGLNNSKDYQACEVANLMQVLLDTMDKK